jgi:hypothetical protein
MPWLLRWQRGSFLQSVIRSVALWLRLSTPRIPSRPRLDPRMSRVGAATEWRKTTQAVDGIVGMAEILSGGLGFLAFWGAKTDHPIRAALLCFASSLAKETGVFLSLVISVYYFRQTTRSHRIRRAVVVPCLAFALFFAVRLYLFGVKFSSVPGDSSGLCSDLLPLLTCMI